MRTPLALAAAVAVGVVPAQAQRPTIGNAVRPYVSVDAPTVAITHVRVIDGTGAPARADQTVIIQDGKVAAVGSAATLSAPAGAQVIDGAGKTVIPGLVMVHEHLFYPTGPGVYGNLSESFSRLYLAGGVTAMRTGGNMNGFGELALAKADRDWQKPGPWIDGSAPYLEGPGLGLGQVHTLTGVDDARRQVNYWADMGATSFKAYMHISRDELKAAAEEVHKRGMKITGHLCSVTYREAADAGIDDLEHGFFASTDFVKDKKPDECPGQGVGQASIAALDVNEPAFRSLVSYLVSKHVAMTSTFTVFETFTPGQPLPPGLDVLTPQLREQFEQRWQRTQQSTNSGYAKLFPNAMKMEVAFYRAGGLLICGTDPTGGGGVIPGYSNQRQVELMVDAGLTPLEAIKVATLNGATYLGIADRTGTIAAGKQADLVLVAGDPSTNISDIRHVETVFRQGVGFDPAKLIASVKGMVGVF
ncbi:MAG TPA: amidohydrolase family protein [Gemmatimonadaceae bacterium]|nr:amidohydrolase family protein [Gemmatimonadaceae bacterium]